MSPSAAERGFTLVEMLVALALFGIVAAIATALSTGATRSFAASRTALAGLSGLERARTLLAADLGQAAERPSLAADGKVMGALTVLPQGFVLVRRGRTGALPSVEKVAWGFDGRSLLRQSFPAIDGAAPGPAFVVVPDVRGLSVRVQGAEGWQQGWAPRRPEQLPRALELTLVEASGRSVTMKFLVAA